jgi:hypothetical protein
MARDEALFWVVVLCVPAMLGLAVWGLTKVPRLVRGWRYDWARAKHLVLEEAVPVEPERDFYGSMSLADEPYASGPLVDAQYGNLISDEPDWLAQTRADLAPEALDSGPGEAPSVDPGPDPIILHMVPEAEAEQWLRDHADDYRPRLITDLIGPSRLADTGDIMDAALAADVAAYQRAQDDQVQAWCSGWERERREYTRQLAEAWA